MTSAEARALLSEQGFAKQGGASHCWFHDDGRQAAIVLCNDAVSVRIIFDPQEIGQLTAFAYVSPDYVPSPSSPLPGSAAYDHWNDSW